MSRCKWWRREHHWVPHYYSAYDFNLKRIVLRQFDYCRRCNQIR